MADYGTEVFKQIWRKSGFLAALDQIEPRGDITPESFRRMNAAAMQEKLNEMRKELSRMQDALDRVQHDTRIGMTGAKINSAHFDQNLITLGGWVVSALETFGKMQFYLSEAGYKRTQGFLYKYMESDTPTHPSYESSNDL